MAMNSFKASINMTMSKFDVQKTYKNYIDEIYGLPDMKYFTNYEKGNKTYRLINKNDETFKLSLGTFPKLEDTSFDEYPYNIENFKKAIILAIKAMNDKLKIYNDSNTTLEYMTYYVAMNAYIRILLPLYVVAATTMITNIQTKNIEDTNKILLGISKRLNGTISSPTIETVSANTSVGDIYDKTKDVRNNVDIAINKINEMIITLQKAKGSSEQICTQTGNELMKVKEDLHIAQKTFDEEKQRLNKELEDVRSLNKKLQDHVSFLQTFIQDSAGLMHKITEDDKGLNETTATSSTF